MRSGDTFLYTIISLYCRIHLITNTWRWKTYKVV